MTYWFYGGFGSIGSSLTKSFDIGDNEIFISGRGDIFERRFYCIKTSRRKIEKIHRDLFFKKYLYRIDVCLYLACPIVPSSKNPSISSDHFINNEIKHVEEVIKSLHNSCNCFIYFSSGGAIYDDSLKDINHPFNETSPLKPRSVYGNMKIKTEDFLFNSAFKSNISIYSLRLANPYGIIKSNGKEQGVIPIYRDNIILNKPIYQYGDGTQIRDYIHIDDVIRAIYELIKYKGKYRIFNIGTGQGTSLTQLIKMIESALKLKANIIKLPKRETDMNYSVVDYKLAFRELNWKPLVKFDHGLIKTLNI